MIKPEMQIVDGRAMTTSVIVAKTFERSHKNVLQSIENVLPHVSEGFGRLNFQPTSYTDQWQRQQPCYYLSRNGFAMIALGFTGEKAIKFREAYVTRYDEMESYLRRKSYKDRLFKDARVSEQVLVALGKARAEFSLTFAMNLMQARNLDIPHVTRDQMIKLIETGVIEGRKRDRQWHVYQDSFAEWLERRKSDS